MLFFDILREMGFPYLPPISDVCHCSHERVVAEIAGMAAMQAAPKETFSVFDNGQGFFWKEAGLRVEARPEKSLVLYIEGKLSFQLQAGKAHFPKVEGDWLALLMWRHRNAATLEGLRQVCERYSR